MSRSYIPIALRRAITLLDNERCAYCQTQSLIIGVALEIDYIWPESLGEQTSEDNLCLACSKCNSTKQNRVNGIDPATDTQVQLFNPRTQNWQTHFRWSGDGSRIEGVTSCGRATVTLLQMNNALIVRSRLIWISDGHHPP